MRGRLLGMILAAILVSPAAFGESAAPEVRIGSAGFDFAPSIVARAILSEAYVKAGYRPVFLSFPPNRMIASLDSGEIDALILAESSFSDAHPDAIRIETKLWVDELVVFSKHPLTVRGWESLKPFRIGYVSGMLIIETHLAHGFAVYPVGNPTQLFRMLESGHTDVVVTSRALGELTMATLGIIDVLRADGTLAIVPNYHYLSKKNGEVARRLSAVLDEMERSGRIAEITKATLSRLFPTDDE
jgi:polar amino acid transport system substrate-binding protein